MISIYKIENTNIKPNDDYISVELRGLSSDLKPTEIANKKIDNGSMYLEIDTGKIFLYDLESQTWKEA